MYRRYKSSPIWTLLLFMASGLIVLHLITLFDEKIGLNNSTISGKAQAQFNASNNRSYALARRLPKAIIIGTRKSGTRALLKFLSLNPVIKAAKKEVHFFDKSVNYQRGLEWYREQMPPSLESDITIEKSPAYFVSQQVPQRIRAMNSSIKLVVIFQDPVLRLISDYSQMMANRLDGYKNDDYTLDSSSEVDYELKQFNLTLGNITSGNRTQELEHFWAKAQASFHRYTTRPDGGIDEHRRAIKIGMYSSYMEKWLQHFDLSQFHFVDAKKLITDPHQELHELETFLGLNPIIGKEDFVFNPRKGFYCLSPRASQCKMKSNCELKSVNVSISSMNCLGKTKGRRHVAVSQDLTDKLRRFYAPYNEYLYSLIGRNFSWTY